MINPFTTIPEYERENVASQWLSEGLVENSSCGYDLMSYEDEWRMYTVGQVKQLARLAGFEIQLSSIDLNILLNSARVIKEYESDWINGINTMDELYMDIVLSYLDDINANPDKRREN